MGWFSCSLYEFGRVDLVSFQSCSGRFLFLTKTIIELRLIFFYSKIFLKSSDALPIKWEQCVKSEQVMILPNYNYKLSNENSEKNLNSAEIRNKRWWILRNSTVKLDSIFLFCKRNVVESCLPSWNFITRIYLRIHLHRPGGINYSKKTIF